MMTGNVWRYGDNIDTDFIYPARYLNISEPKGMAPHCMADLDPAFQGKVKTGDFVVAGRNFGCGSSREHAPVSIKENGIACVIAESFARIFYRNAINIGLPLLEIGEQARTIQEGDQLRLNLEVGVIENLTRGERYIATPLPPFIQKIVSAGGLANYVREEV
ncbi:MAG: 3-isopropylmalate dehydratase small subunit [Negativicutes bacterium]|nr:3-isopropylmalate dehydratase small subunit [Negativicutes bacterium]